MAAYGAVLENMLDRIVSSFRLNFIKDDRWRYLTDGLVKTLQIAFFAVLIGIVIGVVVATVRSTYVSTGRRAGSSVSSTPSASST